MSRTASTEGTSNIFAQRVADADLELSDVEVLDLFQLIFTALQCFKGGFHMLK